MNLFYLWLFAFGAFTTTTPTTTNTFGVYAFPSVNIAVAPSASRRVPGHRSASQLFSPSSRTELHQSANRGGGPAATRTLDLIETADAQRRRLTNPLDSLRTKWDESSTVLAVTDAVDRVASVTGKGLSKTAWMFPLGLCLVPLYYSAALGSLPETPAMWKVANLDLVQATSIVTAFLVSNVSYFLAAAHLMLQSKRTKSLGLWVLAAGAVSTVYHSVQAVGGSHGYALAEALCFCDHGVAGTAILYFMSRAGLPSKRTWCIGGVGLALLAWPSRPHVYAVLHSAWHLVSAATAVVWVHDSGKLHPE